MKTKKTKRKNKYTELRAAIAAVQRINRELLAVLPQCRRGGAVAEAATVRATTVR